MTAARLEPDRLSRRCDPSSLRFATTEDLEPLDGAVGQPRAAAAIEFGLEIGTPGYNIFAAGPIGTGKRSMLETHLGESAARRPTPGDLTYLFNFAEPEQPMAISLPPGRAKELAGDMTRFVEEARRQIGRAFESEDYEHSRRELSEELERRREERLEELRGHALERGFSLKLTPMGVVTIPMLEGHPATKEEFAKLPDSLQRQIEQASKDVEGQVGEFVTWARAQEREARQQLRKLDRDVALWAVGHLVEDLKAEYAASEELAGWLDRIGEDILENLDQFRPAEEGEVELPGPLAGAMRRSRLEFFGRYAVNVFVSHDEGGGAPVVVETNPTYYNLFGRIDYQTAFGAIATDHRYIRPGAVHRANGGYLLIQAADALTKPFVWDKLKEVLRTRRLQIENMGAQYTLFPTAALTPEPIDLDLKVVMIGPAALYDLLFALDEDFRKLFQVKADFDVEMPWDDGNAHEYGRFVAGQVREQGLLHFDRAAVARAVEYGARAAEDRRRLSTRFFEVAALVAEASHWAAHDGAKLVGAKHVARALEQKEYRSNLIEEKVRELIAEGTLMVDTRNAIVGQVNGLEVALAGDYSFGRPVRITATTGPGDGDLINLDRETEMSGPIHDKGFLILTGFLRERYASDRPLSLNASITFEQSYQEVEGDSASSTELYALMSSLAGAPIRQAIAVTGSVNQRGDIQPIGGVNEKVEGFYHVCKERGLSGDEGVLIPATNVDSLMLKDEVVDAVREGRFNVWAVETADEGIELLTGLDAGERAADGLYPEGTIHRLIEDRLAALAEAVKEAAGGGKE
jgi:lon-related putative ATP-dependent protease